MQAKKLEQIEASEKKLVEVFSDNYNFSIPPYQRPYAWDTEQAGELLDDLREARTNPEETDSFYFLGSIVLVKNRADPTARIVDGQQRLTTLTILLSVIRDLSKKSKSKSEIATYIKQEAKRFAGLPEILRLKLRERDQSFFEHNIQTDGATLKLEKSEDLEGSRARIVENAILFRDQLSNLTEDERDILLKFILTNCFIVVVSVPTDSAARRIFTVLNARGLDLSATDILKADLLERAGQDLEVEMADRWEVIETDLDRDKFVDLFTYIRMIFERDKPRSALDEGFPKCVQPFQENPKIFIQEILEPYSKSFTLLFDDSTLKNKFGANTLSLVRSLRRLDNKDWVPALLFNLHRCKAVRDTDISRFVAQLERLAYYLFVTRSNINARIARYVSVLDHIDPRAGKSNDLTGLDLKKEEVFDFLDALNGQIYSRTSRVVKPLLLRLDFSLSSDASAMYDYPTITVEHVMPQTLQDEGQWDLWFEDRTVHKYWLHRLANLVLLSHRKNVKASNYDLDRKKNEYFFKNDTCPFLLTSQIRSTNRWDPNYLQERQIDLLRTLACSWEFESEFDEWLSSKESILTE